MQAAEVMYGLQTDPRTLELLVEGEFDDAINAVEPMGGQRKRKGGAGEKGKAAAAVAKAVETSPTNADATKVKADLTAAVAKGEAGKQEVVAIVAANQRTVAQMIGAKVEALKRVALPVTAVAGVATVLNRPTFYGNIARVAAEVFRSALNTSVQSTWGQWGEAFLDIGRAGGVIIGTLAQQAAQGPVIPFALATMYVAWDANRRGTTMTGLLSEYGSAIKNTADTITKTQVDAFQDALKSQSRVSGALVLKEIASRVELPLGEGARKMSAAVASQGAPAIGSTGVVPSRVADSMADALKSLTSAPSDVIVDNTEARKAAAALLSLADLPKSDIVESPDPGANVAVAPAAPAAPGANAAAAPDAPMNAGRRRRRTKRRAPKRKRITRKMPIFVY